MANLAEAIQGLVQNMRAEQQMIRNWADAQADQHGQIKRLLEMLMSERQTASLAAPHVAPQDERDRGRIGGLLRQFDEQRDPLVGAGREQRDTGFGLAQRALEPLSIEDALTASADQADGVWPIE